MQSEVSDLGESFETEIFIKVKTGNINKHHPITFFIHQPITDKANANNDDNDDKTVFGIPIFEDILNIVLKESILIIV